ncbi:MAG: 3-hydroxybutyryl-CoA dehydrogenase [Peptococcaceae bacterium BRH_c4a]|nr:MAG: 3-hydroxybutyryl-CoA dehydrogenase [Peptococcaceae bacterium BRH_c4a]
MEIKTLTVIGAGTMGRGIAQMGAVGGYDVFLVDTDEKILQSAIQMIEKNLQKGVQLGKVLPEAQEAAMKRLKATTDRTLAASASDFVIEAVPEIITLKIEIFRDLDRTCPPHAILATNTSGLSVTEIAATTGRPDKVIGMHFFNPVHLMKLIEIIRGLETSDGTMAATESVAVRMGKETVEVNEFPGFVTSRINAMIGNEAFYLLQEGVASAENIDKAIKLGLNHPMGPLELGDLVGLDARLRVLEHLHATLGEKYRPCPLMAKYVKAGRLGRKTGRGVYDYTGK